MPSISPGYTHGQAVDDALYHPARFYFLGIRKLLPWLPSIWLTTGEVWQFEGYGKFNILTPDRIRR